MIDLAVLLAVVAASPVTAEKPAEKPAKEKKICRVLDETGSNMPRRTCRTLTDWTKIDAAQAKANPRGTASTAGGPRGTLDSPNSK